ncbi:hypothetical protein NDU88_004096 [Pleurodeles waltl]|uniref:Uncharacterized protein n=1 Tax=Pleurodeles waltl TaxID=8319 RepID=A0AAV7PGH2_PLEWA|nr:hypothetical protein NDU88_004096 [Pleurodeles waltl]
MNRVLSTALPNICPGSPPLRSSTSPDHGMGSVDGSPRPRPVTLRAGAIRTPRSIHFRVPMLPWERRQAPQGRVSG